MELLPQVLIDGLTVGGTYALGAVGVSLVFGVLNIINFGQGAAYTVSAFVAMAMLTIVHVPVIVAFPTGIVAAFFVGWVIERVAVRPLHAQPRLMALITTMGLGLVIENLARFVFGPQTQPLSADLPSVAYQFGNTTISIWELVTMAVVLVATFGLHVVLHHTNFGAAVRAIAEDQRAASLLGINVEPPGRGHLLRRLRPWRRSRRAGRSALQFNLSDDGLRQHAESIRCFGSWAAWSR